MRSSCVPSCSILSQSCQIQLNLKNLPSDATTDSSRAPDNILFSAFRLMFDLMFDLRSHFFECSGMQLSLAPIISCRVVKVKKYFYQKQEYF